MKARLAPESAGSASLVMELIAEDGDDAKELVRAYRAGHLHFVAKALETSRRTRGRTVLTLKPSIRKWRVAG